MYKNYTQLASHRICLRHENETYAVLPIVFKKLACFCKKQTRLSKIYFAYTIKSITFEPLLF